MRILKGRYEVGERAPGAARSFLAMDRETGRRCVVNTIEVPPDAPEGLRPLLEREAARLRSIEHPNIPAFLDFFADEEGGTRLHLVQAHVSGVSIEERVSRGALLSSEEVLKVGFEIGGALACLHGFSPPILHRDIKPRNVILSPDGRIHLVDCCIEPAGEDMAYAPFETLAGRPVQASDIYSLGATLLFAATGKSPASLGLTAARPDLAAAVPGLDPGLRPWLALVLEPDWRRRPRSAFEFLRLLALGPGELAITRTDPRTVAVAAATLAVFGAVGWFFLTRIAAMHRQADAVIARPREPAAAPIPDIPRPPEVQVPQVKDRYQPQYQMQYQLQQAQVQRTQFQQPQLQQYQQQQAQLQWAQLQQYRQQQAQLQYQRIQQAQRAQPVQTYTPPPMPQVYQPRPSPSAPSGSYGSGQPGQSRPSSP